MDTITSRLAIPACKCLISDLKNAKRTTNTTQISDLNMWRIEGKNKAMKEMSIVWIQGNITKVSLTYT